MRRQSSVPMTWMRATTGPDTEGHWSIAVSGPLLVIDHVPGPCNGTSATLKSGLRAPESTPFETLTFGAGAFDLAIERIAAT